MAGIVFGSRAVEFDTEVMQLVPEFPMETIPVFEDAKSHLGKAMGLVADTISREWGTDRYVREERVLD